MTDKTKIEDLGGEDSKELTAEEAGKISGGVKIQTVLPSEKTTAFVDTVISNDRIVQDPIQD